MRALVVVSVVVANLAGGCGPRRAEPLGWPYPYRLAASNKPVREAAPSAETISEGIPAPVFLDPPPLSIDLSTVEPDPTHELRWPLGLNDHPELAPHFEIARQLAEPGVDWTYLCKVGAHRRRIPRLADQLVYLRAWCAVAQHDIDAAIGLLAQLRRSVVPGMATAIRADLPNLLAHHGEENEAREMLAKHALTADSEVLDRLAATYVEIGKLAAATEINELAITNDSGASKARSCQRLARRILLDPKASRASTLFTPDIVDHTLFGAKLDADPTCHALGAEITCWLQPGACAAWYKLRGVSAQHVNLDAAHAAWPTGAAAASVGAWLEVAQNAIGARPEVDAYRYAVIAVESALAVTPCGNKEQLLRVATIALELQGDARISPELRARASTVLTHQGTLCWTAKK